VGAAPVSILPDGGLALAALDAERREVVGLDMVADTMPGGVRMRIRATAEVGIFPPVAVEQVVEVTGAPLAHTDYALLSNNVSCVLCHADVRSLPLEMNREPQNFNTFERVRVGSLDALLARSGTGPNAAHSRVAGTVYTRGENIIKENLEAFSDDELARSTFRGFEFSKTDEGTIMQDQFGNMHDVPLINARPTDEGVPAFANLYTSYPTEEDAMVDGVLPNSFPVPYPDRNGNRKVENDEFAEGTITAAGNLTGGAIYGVPAGTAYTLPAEGGLPTEGNTNVIQSSFDGHAILTGTAQAPLVIQDEVAINGDLVIRGTVRGWGQLSVRGNVYIIGDITYDDAPESFGESADGTRNGLAIIAGGNVLIGDYLTRRAKGLEDQPSGWRDLFIDAREATKPMPAARAGDPVPMKDVGYFAPDVIDPGSSSISSEGFFEENMSFATSAISQFNQRELAAYYDPERERIAPRFYTLREDAPIYAYGGHTNEALGYTMFYENPFVDVIDPMDPAFVVDGVSPTVLSLGPEGGWISEEHLRQFWHQDELARPDAGAPLRIDSFIYSSNAVLGLVRSKDLHNSNTYGQMVVRGAISAPDLALLVPGKDRQSVPRSGLQLLYDPRVRDFALRDPNQITFRRTMFRYVGTPQEDPAL
jgi:hypothetical protein